MRKELVQRAFLLEEKVDFCACFAHPKIDQMSSSDPTAVAAPYLPSTTHADELLDLLTHKGSPNGGLGPITDMLKYGIKIGRQTGVHVTVSCPGNACPHGLGDSELSYLRLNPSADRTLGRPD